MVTQNAAATLGLHLGQTLLVELTPTARSGPERRLRLRIVGIGLLNREVVQDEIARFPTYIVATPALTRSDLGDVETLLLRSPAAGRYPLRSRGGEPLPCDRALLHRLSRRFSGGSRGRAVNQTGGARSRGVRCHRRTGSASSRDPGHRSPAGRS